MSSGALAANVYSVCLQIRSQLESATASNTELNESLDSLRADLRAAEAELDRQQVVAADSVAKIASLEAALADARAQDETRQSAALAEFATLCESLESDVTGLRTRYLTFLDRRDDGH